MTDNEKIIQHLEMVKEEIRTSKYDTWFSGSKKVRFMGYVDDALKLLKEWETEIQIASTGGFQEGYSQAMSEMPEEKKHMTNDERFDLQNIQEIRDGNGNVRYIRNGSYVVLRRDIYDQYREKAGEIR